MHICGETHDSSHNLGATQNVLPLIVPTDLALERVVKFKVTVVRDYETWFASRRRSR
jgi:hypothetical protein